MSGEVTVREHSDGTLEKMVIDSSGVWHTIVLTADGRLLQAEIQTLGAERAREN